MSERHHLHIVAFTGLEGSGKSTALEYLTQKGFPKVNAHDMVAEIEHLAQAGQHVVVTDEIADLPLFESVKHAFPGQLIVVGITTNTRIRHERLVRDDYHPVSDHDARTEDWAEAERGAAPFALADYFIENNENKEALYEKIDALLKDLELNV
jgi:dephospho-CoA kinase